MSTAETVKQFNEKVAELIKESSPDEIAEILRTEESMISALHNNNNQNSREA